MLRPKRALCVAHVSPSDIPVWYSLLLFFSTGQARDDKEPAEDDTDFVGWEPLDAVCYLLRSRATVCLVSVTPRSPSPATPWALSWPRSVLCFVPDLSSFLSNCSFISSWRISWAPMHLFFLRSFQFPCLWLSVLWDGFCGQFHLRVLLQHWLCCIQFIN